MPLNVGLPPGSSPYAEASALAHHPVVGAVVHHRADAGDEAVVRVVLHPEPLGRSTTANAP